VPNATRTSQLTLAAVNSSSFLVPQVCVDAGH